MNEWNVVKEFGDWKTFEKNVTVKDKETGDKSEFNLRLEEVNKRWDRPFNWRLTVSEVGGKSVKVENFYLNVDHNTAVNAKDKAADIFPILIAN